MVLSKKSVLCILAIFTALLLVACTATQEEPTGLPQEPEPTQKFEALCDSAPDWVREHEEFTAQFNCVESCPQESYSTQIGLQVCIDLLDREYFESLPTCERSSSSCDCILPTSTTDSQEIDVGFRCVDHENYKHRMIFYGLTRAEEDGEISTIIA